MDKKKLLLILTATVIGTATATVGVTRAIEAATEVARINGRVITLQEFNKLYHENAKYFQGKTPTRKEVMDEIIKRELAIQEARRIGLDRDPDVRDQMETVLYHSLVNRKLAGQIEKIHVTDEEARRFYDRNPEIRTSHIFVAVPWDAPADQDRAARARIERIYDEYLRPGKIGFAEVAQRLSEGPSAVMGGDLDFMSRDKLDPAYYQAALKLRTGQISPIVRSQFGYHIIKLTDRHSWEEADRGLAKRLLIDDRRQQLYESYMALLWSHAHISIHNELLREEAPGTRRSVASR